MHEQSCCLAMKLLFFFFSDVLVVVAVVAAKLEYLKVISLVDYAARMLLKISIASATNKLQLWIVQRILFFSFLITFIRQGDASIMVTMLARPSELYMTQ